MCLPMPHVDKMRQEKGTFHGFEYEIVANGHGYRCGYVKVIPGHPWFGKHYDEIECRVHGGLTFASAGKACPTHDEKAEWWIGFDCAHAGDTQDWSDALWEDLKERDKVREIHESIARKYPDDSELRSYWTPTIKDNDYVRAECESLAAQAQAAMVGE